MQTVGAYNQIKPTLTPAFELNLYAVCIFSHADDLIAENDFCRAPDFFEQQPRQVAAPKRHKSPAGQFAKNPSSKASDAPTPIVDKPHLAHVIADALDVACQAHALCNVVAETPEVDDIAAGSQRGPVLDQGWLKPRSP